MSNSDWSELVEGARSAAAHAYVPYSGFRTGAAVRTAGGEVYYGALVENLVFGAAMCAERVALFSMVAAGSKDPKTLVLAAPTTAGRTTYPCGECLQVAVELGGPDLRIVAAPLTGEDDVAVRALSELAPEIPRRYD